MSDGCKTVRVQPTATDHRLTDDIESAKPNVVDGHKHNVNNNESRIWKFVERHAGYDGAQVSDHRDPMAT